MQPSKKTIHNCLLISMLILLTAALVLVSASAKELDCENAYTTPDTNRCAAIELAAAEVQMEHYLDASLKRHQHDSESVNAIQTAQHVWQQYATNHCDAVYSVWRDGTIRSVMALVCKTELTQQRTHTLWKDFLTYIDSTPPILPEPIAP